jgi:hypothetical protein
MAFNFALFVKHPDPEYLTFNPDFINAEIGSTGYDSAYFETITELGNELGPKVAAGDTPGDFTVHTDDPTICVIERHWASLEAAQAWISIVVAIHQANGAPAPLEAKVVNLLTNEETIIYPTT